MTLHQDIIRTQIEHGCDPVQAMVILWQQGIAPEHRKSAGNWPHLHRGTETLKARAAERFEVIIAEVMPHHRKGLTAPQIREATGYATNTIRKAIRAQGLEPHPAVPNTGTAKDISHLFPQVAEMRKRGMCWKSIGKAIGVGRDRMRREFTARYEAKL